MTVAGPLEVYSVSELNRQVKRLLEDKFTPVWLEGEISNFKHHTSGHMYFALKDEQAQIAAVMFVSANRALTFKPRDGQQVLARGTLTLYESRGQYQLAVQNLYPSGAGELWLRLEALRERLQAEGLFDPARQRELPFFPRRIGVVTSPTGAAVQDIISVIERRAPHVTLIVRPTLVQGDRARASIAEAVRVLGAEAGVDLIIIARGGGSLEDLWPFNEEEVVRAVAACPVPTLSAVGHETDVTLCDLAADLRAPTPSAAVELAVGERAGYLQFLDERGAVLERQLSRLIQRFRQQLGDLQTRYGFRQPLVLIKRQREQLQLQASALSRSMDHLLAGRSRTLASLSAQLEAMDPDQVMARGYAMVSDAASGRVITRRGQLQVGQSLSLRFKDGQAQAAVTHVEDTD